ncbi:cyclin-T2a [Lampris incognitus]|uniref:cyclin-T2a n=1 Tax=Lampris incognitus TaxID=2546036 RepID=UPI0024B5234F|nr:cyclin-T2a [Lampris incognitus]
MAAYRGSSSRWVFTREQLENTPSRRCGIEPDRELSYRQQSANLIQDMGQRLNVSQLTINTAIVYMHRFYMHHSFTKLHRNIISPTTLFLAAKVEEQPRKLEHVIKVAHACLNAKEPPLDTKSNAYLQQAQELVILETIVLQTLGFEITIEHPHTDVVKCSQLVRASKDLAQTSYFMATNSLHLTTFCLQYKPTVIACVCIHLACKWSNWQISVSTDGKPWWQYVDNSVTLELLNELTHEFLQILEKTPSRLKRIRNWRATQAAKKPKSDGSQSADGSFVGPSMLQDHSMGGPSTSSSTLSVPMPSSSGENSLAGSYSLTGPTDWVPVMYAPIIIKQEPLSPPHLGAALSLQTATSSSSLLQQPSIKIEKPLDFHAVKHEHKVSGGGGGNKHQPPPLSAFPPPPTQPSPSPSPAQKLSLDKYREKHAAELAAAGQKRRLEQHGGAAECDPRADSSYTTPSSSYAPSSTCQVGNRKHSQPHQMFQHAYGGSSSTTASPVKVKLPSSSGQERRHHSDKREKGSGSLKLRVPVPMSSSSSQSDKSGQLSKEELKIKVSSTERHSLACEGGAANNSSSKSKHSSPMVSKEKQHRGGEHAPHRHHKHGHSQSLAHSGNGRGGPELHGGMGGLLRSPLGLVGMEGAGFAPSGTTSSSTSSSSRKRAYPEAIHNNHSSSTSCSKVSKSSKGGASAAGTSSSPCSPHSSLLLQCMSSGSRLNG